MAASWRAGRQRISTRTGRLRLIGGSTPKPPWYSPRERSPPMAPERPTLPPEAIELYNRYIHGEITRRAFLSGAKRLAIGGLTAAAIVEALMPKYAEAQQVAKTDDRIKAT